MSFEYHVAKSGSDSAEGSKQNPFLTINKAASLATAGDKVIVHEGEYREWVNPQNTGLSDFRRISYEAAEGEKVVIKGSEQIKDWEPVEDNIWRTEIPNEFFGNYNPYVEEIFGDWVEVGAGKHLGEVYLNGMSFYEAEEYKELFKYEVQKETLDHWTDTVVPVKNQGQTKYLWFVEVNSNTTKIYANFHDYNPNEELVEINVRKHVFYPEKTNMNYISVKGFELCHAATPWAPPTADQPGLIGAHWSKGWIIEDNIVHDAKCSAISIGKEISTGDNFSSKRKDKPGYQYQLESVFQALHSGWTKENIGSHIIRNNTIYDCGQNGIVGHLGCIFSEISNNRIYNIGIKREFYGYEIAGIKLHAAIDTQIYDNCIHDCSLGVWLDWQTQGTRVSRNVFYNNSRDLFVEVSSGPYLVDNNILTADYALDNHAQGGAYVNNLIRGEMVHRKMLDRATPYHFAHSTFVSGFAPVYGGDDRFYNNIFIGDKKLSQVGTDHYDGYPASLDEYIEAVSQEEGDHQAFHKINQPVFINNNAYLNGASSFDREQDNYENGDFDPELTIVEDGNEVLLHIKMPEGFDEISGKVYGTENLEKVRLVDQDFTQPDGQKLVIDHDIQNKKRSDKSHIGPFNALKQGSSQIKIWG